MINPEDLPQFTAQPDNFDPGFMRGPSDEERRGYALQMAVQLYAAASVTNVEYVREGTLDAAEIFVEWLETGTRTDPVN